jgi:hypothetical protein
MDITCPTGKVVIGGGGSSAYDVFFVTSAPKLDGTAWTAYFRNDVLFGTQTVEGYAVCANASAIAGRHVISTSPAMLGPGAGVAFDQLSLQCPAGQKVLSIGIASTASTVNQGWIHYTTISNKRPPPFWEAGVKNTSGLDNVTTEVRLVAICANAI